MAESIVKVPSTASGDFDFLAFSFNGKHSYEDFGIIRTSDGNRYNENLAPTLQDKTAEVPSGDGMYYFGSTHKQRDFNISFVFDNMSETTFREMKQWFNGKEMGDLWFSEAPYKVWTAKVSGQPNIKYIPFDEEYIEEGKQKTRRVYKGEGTVNFVAYWPYAHTPDYVTDAGLLYIEEREDVFYADGRLVATDIFSKQTFKKNKKYTIVFESLGLTFALSEKGEIIEVAEPGVSIILYTATHLRQQNTTLNKNVWVPPREGKTSGFVFNDDYKGKNYCTFSCDEDFIINFAGRWYEGNKSEKYTIKYKYALYEGEVEPESFPVKKDAKNLNNWSGFSNKDQWAIASNIQPQIKTAIGENYGDYPSHFELKMAKINEDLQFNIGNNSLVIRGKDKNYNNVIWNSRTGLVTAENSDRIRVPIPYEGSSIDAIPAGNIRILTIKKYSGDKFQDYLRSSVETPSENENKSKWKEYIGSAWADPSKNTVIPTLNYHYWYY